MARIKISEYISENSDQLLHTGGEAVHETHQVETASPHKNSPRTNRMRYEESPLGASASGDKGHMPQIKINFNLRKLFVTALLFTFMFVIPVYLDNNWQTFSNTPQVAFSSSRVENEGRVAGVSTSSDVSSSTNSPGGTSDSSGSSDSGDSGSVLGMSFIPDLGLGTQTPSSNSFMENVNANLGPILIVLGFGFLAILFVLNLQYSGKL